MLLRHGPHRDLHQQEDIYSVILCQESRTREGFAKHTDLTQPHKTNSNSDIEDNQVPP